MSELKVIELGEARKLYFDDKEFYIKNDADEVIYELKAENERLLKENSCKFYKDCLRVRNYDKELKATQRALWMARALALKRVSVLFYLLTHSTSQYWLNNNGCAEKARGDMESKIEHAVAILTKKAEEFK